MMLYRCAALLLLTLQKCVFCYPPCGSEKNISAVEGEDVILQVDEEECNEISWVVGGAHIATTTPNTIIDIKSSDYKSKLYTEKNGSLGITKVIMEDSRTFIASIFKNENACSQSYHLTVYKMDKSEMMVITLITVCVFLIIMGAACAYCLRKKIKQVTLHCSTCFREHKPNNAVFTDGSQNDNLYYEIQLKGDSPATTPSHKKTSAEKQAIYSTITNPPMGVVKKQAQA